MKAKVISINKPNDLPSYHLTIEQCKQMFKAEAHGYSDGEVIQMKDFLFKLAKIYYEFYRTVSAPYILESFSKLVELFFLFSKGFGLKYWL